MVRMKREAKNSAAILKTYSAGASLDDLRNKFGIRSKGQLANAVLDALIHSGKMPKITRGRAKKKLPSEFPVKVNKRGTIVLTKDAVAGVFRFVPGQSFVARRRGKKIILTLAG